MPEVTFSRKRSASRSDADRRPSKRHWFDRMPSPPTSLSSTKEHPTLHTCSADAFAAPSSVTPPDPRTLLSPFELIRDDYNSDFGSKVCRRWTIKQTFRIIKYGEEIAGLYTPGWTPTHIVEARERREEEATRKFLEEEEAYMSSTTDEQVGSTSYADNGGHGESESPVPLPTCRHSHDTDAFPAKSIESNIPGSAPCRSNSSHVTQSQGIYPRYTAPSAVEAVGASIVKSHCRQAGPHQLCGHTPRWPDAPLLARRKSSPF